MTRVQQPARKQGAPICRELMPGGSVDPTYLNVCFSPLVSAPLTSHGQGQELGENIPPTRGAGRVWMPGCIAGEGRWRFAVWEI